MKGVLLGVDFVTQTDGTVKLLEVNTGVQFSNDFNYFNYQALVDLAVENNLSGIALVDKSTTNSIETFDSLSAACSAAGITFEHIDVDKNAITVPEVENESSKLVVRIAYDTNAIVDHNYARDNQDFAKLFHQYGSGSNIVNTFYSSSNGTFDNLTTGSNTVSGNIVPNIIVKKRYPDIYKNDFPHFYNVSNQAELDELKVQYTGDYVINNFVVDTNNLINDKLGTQVRKWYFLYGGTLSVLPLGGYRYTNQAPLKLPLGIVEGANQIEHHERKALTSNAASLYYYGVPSDSYVDKIVSGSHTDVLASEINVGDTVKTVVIPGVTLENDTEYVTDGLGYPSGSYYSSSIVISKTDKIVNDHLLKFTLSGSEAADLILSQQEKVFTYSTSDDKTRFRAADDIKIGDKIITNLSNNVTVVGKEFNYYTGSYTTLDVEDVDAFIGGPTVNLNIFIHNAPCFVAGTKILTKEGYVNIEDVKAGDIVLTYNHDIDAPELKEVLEVKQKADQSTIIYEIEDGTIIEATPDHPLYVVGKGYCSYDPKASKDDSGLEVKQIGVGDILLHENLYTSAIVAINESKDLKTVYNLDNVDTNNNFFANSYLVHNRKSR